MTRPEALCLIAAAASLLLLALGRHYSRTTPQKGTP